LTRGALVGFILLIFCVVLLNDEKGLGYNELLASYELELIIFLMDFPIEFSLKDVGYYSVFEKATEAQYKSRSYIYGGAAVCIGILYLNHSLN
jgi:hypothetical protein